PATVFGRVLWTVDRCAGGSAWRRGRIPGILCSVRRWAFILLVPLLLVACARSAGEGRDRGLDPTTPTPERLRESVLVHVSHSAIPDGGLRTIADPMAEAIQAAGVGEEVQTPIVPDGALLMM